MNIQIENNEDREMCKKCGGSCCRNMGCHYSPDNFNNITYESLKEKIEYNMVTYSRDFSHELVTYQLFNY